MGMRVLGGVATGTVWSGRRKPAPVSDGSTQATWSQILTVLGLSANHAPFLSQVTLLSFAVESESTFLDYIKGG